MENRRRSGGESERRSLVILEENIDGYTIHKLDLNRCYSSSNSYTIVGCSNRRRPSDFSLSGKKKKEKKKKNRHRHRLTLTLGRFGRYLALRNRDLPLVFPKRKKVDCYKVNRELTHRWPGSISMGMAALGSNIYLFGGCYCPKSGYPRDVYVIDASADSLELVKLSCQLNSDMVDPIVYTIGAKIYALPKYFSPDSIFECFDPESNSWTALPGLESFKYFGDVKVETLCERTNYNYYRVRSHVVVGSNLVISLDSQGGVFTFDTTRPNRGWRNILLHLENIDPPRFLNFIPLDPRRSLSIGDNLILSSPCREDGNNKHWNYNYAISGFVEDNFNIPFMDSYVCSFDAAGLSNPECDFVRVSISSVPGMEKRGWQIKAVHPEVIVKSSRTVGDGMVLVLKEGDFYYTLDTLQVGRSLNSDGYVASNISSTLLRTRRVLDGIQIYSNFVIEG